jgi:hypothetical protein
VLARNALIGITYYGILYYKPIYYQYVRQWSPLLSAALMVPEVGIRSVISSIAGYYISSKGRYGEVIWLVYSCWTLGAGLYYMFSRSTHPVAIAFVLMLEIIGVGCIFQPSKSMTNLSRTAIPYLSSFQHLLPHKHIAAKRIEQW